MQQQTAYPTPTSRGYIHDGADLLALLNDVSLKRKRALTSPERLFASVYPLSADERKSLAGAIYVWQIQSAASYPDVKDGLVWSCVSFLANQMQSGAQLQWCHSPPVILANTLDNWLGNVHQRAQLEIDFEEREYLFKSANWTAKRANASNSDPIPHFTTAAALGLFTCPGIDKLSPKTAEKQERLIRRHIIANFANKHWLVTSFYLDSQVKDRGHPSGKPRSDTPPDIAPTVRGTIREKADIKRLIRAAVVRLDWYPIASPLWLELGFKGVGNMDLHGCIFPWELKPQMNALTEFRDGHRWSAPHVARMEWTKDFEKRQCNLELSEKEYETLVDHTKAVSPRSLPQSLEAKASDKSISDAGALGAATTTFTRSILRQLPNLLEQGAERKERLIRQTYITEAFGRRWLVETYFRGSEYPSLGGLIGTEHALFPHLAPLPVTGQENPNVGPSLPPNRRGRVSAGSSARSANPAPVQAQEGVMGNLPHMGRPVPGVGPSTGSSIAAVGLVGQRVTAPVPAPGQMVGQLHAPTYHSGHYAPYAHTFAVPPRSSQPQNVPYPYYEPQQQGFSPFATGYGPAVPPSPTPGPAHNLTAANMPPTHPVAPAPYVPASGHHAENPFRNQYHAQGPGPVMPGQVSQIAGTRHLRTTPSPPNAATSKRPRGY